MSSIDKTGSTQHDILNRSGSRIHYWVIGSEDAPLVVFTHGAAMDHRMFDPQVEPVTSEGYRVLIWDMRGHGKSKPIGEEFSVPAVAEELLTIIDTLGYDEATLIGQSLGGLVSQEVAFRSPDRVTALGVIGSNKITEMPSKLEYVALRLSPYMIRFWPANHLRKLTAKQIAETEPVRQYGYHAASQLSNKEFATVYTAIATGLHSEPGYQFGKPLLLTHGDQDQTGTIVKEAPSWADKEPHCRYEVIPNAGHNANQDNPDFFNQLLLDFLSENDPV
jgi:3-oxoadipate enol-lactonase